MNLRGQVAVISGGLGDIGRAIALELAQRGADISIGDVLEAEKASALLGEIRKLDRRAQYFRVDVTDADAVARWIAETERQLGTATLIVPNAAVVTLADFRSVTPQQWNRELRVNLDGSFHLAQAGAQRLLAEKKEGRVVFIGSWAAHYPHTHIPAYCAAKAGLRMLCKCMALELAPHGILVNEVAPGYVDAGLSAKLMKDMPGQREIAERAVPIQKLITPHDVALQVAHLCDPENKHMTGSVLLMDGGLSLGKLNK